MVLVAGIKYKLKIRGMEFFKYASELRLGRDGE